MLHLHSATDLRALADDLAGVLSDVPDDPMQADWVAVPSAGLRHWLKLQLAARLGSTAGVADGITANIEFPFPGRLRSVVLVCAGGFDAESDPWRIERLVWAVTAASDRVDGLPTSLQPDHLRPVQSGGDVPAPRYPAARHVADLFDRYGVHRPAMIREWANDRDVDAVGDPLVAHQRWQAALWREVRSELGVASAAERMPAVLDDLREDRLEVHLPGRVGIFGVSVLPGGGEFLELAAALAEHREVHIYLLQASEVVRTRAGSIVEASPLGNGIRQRTDVEPVEAHVHPLLTSWGRPHLETGVLLEDASARLGIDIHELAVEASPIDTLLHRIQHDIRTDAVPAGEHHLAPGDDSVQFHACQGMTRQVEVMRDAICHLLAHRSKTGGDLSEDDVLVICPEMERFAPVIEAVLGDSAASTPPRVPELMGGAVGSAPRLRYRLADRAPTASNPVAAAATRILDVVCGRFTASSVVDLLTMPAVRLSTGLEDDDIAQVGEWVAETRVRWGRDARHRGAWNVGVTTEGLPTEDAGSELDDASANTWTAGVGRLLAGMAVSTESDDVAIGGYSPVQVEGANTTVLGRFAAFLWRLECLADAVQGRRSVPEWMDLLRDHLLGLVRAPGDAPWQVDRLLATMAATSRSAEGFDEVCPDIDEVRRLLSDRLDGIPGSSRFFRGGMTITSSAPLRWVPYRVICLLGMDQASLGVGTIDGDDLLADLPAVGDRDPRGDSRQFLLEAVLAAGEHLIVIRDGRDVRTNHEVPPAVPIAELQAVVSATVHGGVDAPGDSRTPRVHPQEVIHARQAWAEHAFTEDGVVRGSRWSFDHGAMRAAGRRRERTAAFSNFAEVPLAEEGTHEVTVDQLRQCLQKPIAFFLTNRLEVRLSRAGDELEDNLPTTTDPLDRYAIGCELLELLDDAGVAPGDDAAAAALIERWRTRERRLGRVPVGPLGEQGKNGLDGLLDEVAALRAAADNGGLRIWEHTDVEEVPVDCTVDGVRIVGTVKCSLAGDRPGPGTVRFSRPKNIDRVGAWVELLLLHTVDPSRNWRSVTARRARKGQEIEHLEISNQAEVAASLSVAVDLFRRAQCEPLPLFGDLSPALHAGEADLSVRWPGRSSDVAESTVFGDLDLVDLLSLPTLDRDNAPAGVGRVEHYADRLWSEVGLLRPVEAPASPEDVHEH